MKIYIPARFLRFRFLETVPRAFFKLSNPVDSSRAIRSIGVRLQMVTAGNGSSTLGTIFTSTLISNWKKSIKTVVVL